MPRQSASGNLTYIMVERIETSRSEAVFSFLVAEGLRKYEAILDRVLVLFDLH